MVAGTSVVISAKGPGNKFMAELEDVLTPSDTVKKNTPAWENACWNADAPPFTEGWVTWRAPVIGSAAGLTAVTVNVLAQFFAVVPVS